MDKGSGLREEAAALLDSLVAWRRDFHRHPELGFEEHRTSSIVADHLRTLGLEVRTGVGKTGVVGLLRGAEPGPTLLLRADMDALPIPDGKDTNYASTATGKAHLCGHDAHTSMLMGTARLLAERGLPRGSVKFAFQPAEEGSAGAKAMIEDGVLDDPKVDAAAALHVWPFLPTGRLGLAGGAAWAASDTIKIRIVGRSGHAAYPHQTIDPIPVAAQAITALQHIASRQVDPLDSVVVTIGQINGGYTRNVIAPEVEMTGTVRTLNPAVRERMEATIATVLKGTAEAHGAAYELEYRYGYPMVINDDDMAGLLTRTSAELLGEGGLERLKPTMGAEDFSFIAERVPSVMFRLGTRGGERSGYPLHHPLFDLDESAMPVGVAMLSAFALNFLNLPRPD
ncbi:M20 metallopeptidase family protein [Paenibacillus flagellatus]|uniref:Amidohydrolase n=1 Tax=Paenibacillus flagellatus TaxID=2211139 RepID=A0A2V5JX33_9BACL|nr:M20 family metallopeptidase [Paenibacillus flagellatus]PYI50772.1 amidohydrolase [Paenibacillus flagellatus]